MQCTLLGSSSSRLQQLLPYRKHAAQARTLSRKLTVTPKAFALTPAYGYVIASVAASAALIQWQGVRVGMARRQYNVPYPQMYAEGKDEKAQTFNCVQRAHQNTLETLPALLAMICLLGLEHPITAAALGMVWNVGRVIYTLGYSTGDPNKRIPGVAIAFLTYVITFLATGVTGIKVTGILGS